LESQPRLMRLERADDDMLRPEVFRPVARRQPGKLQLPGDLQPQAVTPDRLQVRAAGNDAHLVSGQCQFDGQIAADGPGAKHAYLHGLRMVYGGRAVRERGKTPARGGGWGELPPRGRGGRCYTAVAATAPSRPATPPRPRAKSNHPFGAQCRD